MALSNQNNNSLPVSDTSSQADTILTPSSSNKSTDNAPESGILLNNASHHHDGSESTIELPGFTAVALALEHQATSAPADTTLDDALQVRLNNLPQHPHPNSRIGVYAARAQQNIDRFDQAFYLSSANHHQKA
ncbi:hypothetical protein QBC43DRAFT_304619 [Cladorrhinum sp. PSN259]|nr:hypothetical protein QBC43DRAFT_304619 [Cladorrhinum sp. PSN259]